MYLIIITLYIYIYIIIGQKYAMLEGKTVLSTILRNFELLPALPEHVPILSSETVLISKNGLCVSLKEREF